MALGIILMILGVLPVLYGAWRMFDSDHEAFIFAITVVGGIAISVSAIYYGIWLVSR